LFDHLISANAQRPRRREMLTGDSFSIAEEDFRDPVSPDTRAGNAQMIGQEDDRAP
jgi:hypothetical protein